MGETILFNDVDIIDLGEIIIFYSIFIGILMILTIFYLENVDNIDCMIIKPHQ